MRGYRLAWLLIAIAVAVALFAAPAWADITAEEGSAFSGDVVNIGGCNLDSASIDWGDGTAASDGSADGDSVAGTHTYDAAGTYSGAVTYRVSTFPGFTTRPSRRT